MEFTDEKFQTAKEKEKILKNFSKSLKERSLESMQKVAYNHYHLHCGFIAHYDINGFKAEYEGLEFLTFLDAFVGSNWGMQMNDINRTLCELAQHEYPKIVQEFTNRVTNAKTERLKSLAEELGFSLVSKEASEEIPLYIEEADGQLALF